MKLNIYKHIVVIVFILLHTKTSLAQNAIKLTLEDAIKVAQKNSLDYKIAYNTIKASYWNYESYRASFLPKLSLNGSLPDYYRTINSITLPNGQNDFVSQNVANTGLNLNLAQNIGLTGGNIAISSSLRRIDNFGNVRNTRYTTVPFSVSYYQNNLFYNSFRWQKKIEPLRLEETQRIYAENLESISFNTIDKYFNLLMANSQLKLDQQNLQNIDTLLKTTKSRFEIGTVNLNDVLQAKVSLLNARRAVANSELALETAQQAFVRYLSLERAQKVELVLPDSLNFYNISPEIALNEAQANRSYVIGFKRRRLEAEDAIARTRSVTGPSINLRANLGLQQSGNTLPDAYSDLLRNQSVNIGFNIPLVDWGVNRSNRKRAEANLDLESNRIAQEELEAEQEVRYQALKWSIQREQMDISREASKLAQQRYDIARQKYALGTMNFTDFNNAQLDKDRAVTDYINNLRNYWSLHYVLRRITMFNFIENKKITLPDIVKEG